MSTGINYIKVLLQTVAYCKQTLQQKEQRDFLQKHLNLKEKAGKNCGSHKNIKLYQNLFLCGNLAWPSKTWIMCTKGSHCRVLIDTLDRYSQSTLQLMLNQHSLDTSVDTWSTILIDFLAESWPILAETLLSVNWYMWVGQCLAAYPLTVYPVCVRCWVSVDMKDVDCDVNWDANQESIEWHLRGSN